jgi:hypothetical protein
MDSLLLRKVERRHQRRGGVSGFIFPDEFYSGKLWRAISVSRIAAVAPAG